MEIFWNDRKAEYNSIPVLYCKKCLSLKIRGLLSLEYCDSCGDTDIALCSIEEWENMYISKYGHSYLENYGRKEE